MTRCLCVGGLPRGAGLNGRDERDSNWIVDGALIPFHLRSWFSTRAPDGNRPECGTATGGHGPRTRTTGLSRRGRMNREVSRWAPSPVGRSFGPLACALEFHVKQARKRNLTRNFSSEATVDAYGLRMAPSPSHSTPGLHVASEVEVRQLHEHACPPRRIATTGRST